MQQLLYRLSVAALVLVLLVMTAGSIVRMTGSGMGCPDWPTCFGYLIPPTDIETLTWRPGKAFKKGNIIIREDILLVAQYDFTTSEEFNAEPWEPYTKHDYAIFNPVHTWIEFINRLIGVLAGLPSLVLFILSIWYLNRDKWVFIASAAGLFLLGFAAWLGKMVVDGNLVPHSITYHMLSALALVLVYTFLTVRLKKITLAFAPLRNKTTVFIGVLAALFLLLQILAGTNVREQVDTLLRSGIADRSAWVESLNWLFKVHRSFSLVVLGMLIVFATRIIQTRTISTAPRYIVAMAMAEIIAGAGLAYLDFPALLQPLHLIAAALCFCALIYVLMLYIKKTSH